MKLTVLKAEAGKGVKVTRVSEGEVRAITAAVTATASGRLARLREWRRRSRELATRRVIGPGLD